MHKLIRQLKFTQEEIRTSKKELQRVYDVEPNQEIAEELFIVHQKLQKAANAVSEGLDIIGRIYNDCYED